MAKLIDVLDRVSGWLICGLPFVVALHIFTDGPRKEEVVAGALTVVMTHACRKLFVETRKIEYDCKPIPKNPRIPFLAGIDLAIKKLGWIKHHTYLANTAALHDSIGSTFEETSWGRTQIQTIEPENIKAIMTTQFHEFPLGQQRIKAFRPLTGDGLFSTNGPKWAHGRALVKTIFNRAQVANVDVYEKHFQNFVGLIPKDGSTVDLQSLFQRLTIDTASEILFGESMHTLVSNPSKESMAVDAAYSSAIQGIVHRIILGPLICIHPWLEPKFLKAIKTLDDYLEGFVDKALEKALQFRKSAASLDYSEKDGANDGYKQPSKKVFLEELAKDTSDRKLLRDQLMSLLAAGRDTTASLLSSTFWLLAHNPAALQTLREEIAQLNGRIPTYEEVKNMTYLRWVLNETLRLIPPVVAISRSATRNTTLPVGGGPDGKSPIFVHKGQSVMYRIWAVHHATSIWGDDALEFRPERWRDEANKVAWKLISFGGGPRICPGQAGYTTVRLLQTFNQLGNRNDQPFCEAVGAVLAHGNGVKVALVR